MRDGQGKSGMNPDDPQQPRLYINGIPLVSAVPEVMRFESWYYEGSFKHLLRIAFLTAVEVYCIDINMFMEASNCY